MKIYIAGKITDLDGDEAEGNFMFAEMLVEEAGHEPLNPLKMVDQAEGRTYGEYLADALTVLLTQAEGVYFIPNWIYSSGAKIEHFIAIERKIPRYFNAAQLPIGSDWPEPVNPYLLDGDELDRTESARKAGR